MNDPANTGLSGFFTADHRHCDELWTHGEAAVDAGDDAAAGLAWRNFAKAMARHFEMEEEVLFPAFEEATGMHRMGPTFVMRQEHKQMRGVIREMAGAAASGDWELVCDHGDTLLMLIQQHNVKEEGMLYRMAEMHLGHMWADLHGKLPK